MRLRDLCSAPLIREASFDARIRGTQVLRGCFKAIGVVFEAAKPCVAVAAENATDFSRSVAVVDMKAGCTFSIAGIGGVADRASVSLAFSDLFVIGKRNAVVVAQMLFHFVVCIGSIAVSAIAALCIWVVPRSLPCVDAVFASAHPVSDAATSMKAKAFIRLCLVALGTNLHWSPRICTNAT